MLLGNLYHVYSTLLIHDQSQLNTIDEDANHHPATKILESLDKRWLKLDQDLFITCLFLNPFVNRSLINDNALPTAVLMGMI